MKAIKLDLNASVGTSYDQTRTTLLGRSYQKTLTAPQGGKTVVGSPLNTFADIFTDAAVTADRVHVTTNGRAFFTVAIAAGIGLLVLYDFDFNTGAWTYVGKLQYTMPNTPATTHTIRSIRAVDTGTTGWKIFIDTVGTVTANGGLFMLNNVAKADFVPVGFATLPQASAPSQKAVYWLQETGGTNNLITSQGMDTDYDFSGTKVYVGNNLAATFQGYIFDYSLTITTVGASGVTSDLYVLKTGTLPGVLATILLLNNFTVCTPDATSGVSVTNQGQLCMFIPSSTGFNIGKLSEWTSGATSWPSLQNVNTSDATNTNTALTPLTAHFSQTVQRIVSQQNAGGWFVKKFVNNLYELSFGNSSNSQYRTGNSSTIDFYEQGGISITSTFTQNGWLFHVQATAGQISCLAFDLQSEYHYDYSSIISKVIDTPNSQWMSLNITAPVRSFGKFWYRTTGFGSSTGSWIAVPQDRDMSAIVSSSQIQFKFQTRMERDSVTIPLQIIDAFLIHQPVSEISDNWSGSVDNTSTGSPSRSAFRLIKTYATSVPTLYFRAYDDSGTLVASANTTSNPSFFEYSSNNGTSWNALGTIPNTALTTELRYNWASPPGVKVSVSLRES